MKEAGYKYHKISKSEIIDRILETDKIFENVNDYLESIDINNDEGVISLKKLVILGITVILGQMLRH